MYLLLGFYSGSFRQPFDPLRRPYALFKVCAEPRSPSTLSNYYIRNQNKVKT